MLEGFYRASAGPFTPSGEANGENEKPPNSMGAFQLGIPVNS